MLADDDADDRMLFEDAVNEVDAKATLAFSIDGVELMDKLSESATEIPYVIFLDINMPKKNGFECLEQIRLSPLLKDIPVVMYSTSSQEDAVNKAYKAGANFYVKKPDNFCTLKSIIQKVLSINFSISSLTSRDSFILTA